MAIFTAQGATRGSNLGGGAFNAILKEYYRPAVVDQLNSKTVLSRLLGRRSEGVEGKYYVLDLNTNRNFGYGAIDEAGRLPDPLMQEARQARYSMRYTYGRIKFTGPAASGSRSDKGSFIRMMDFEVQGMTRDIQVNDNRILYGDGSGRLCQISGGSGTPGVAYTVTNPGGISSTALGTQYLAPGMRVGFASLGTADGAGSGLLTTTPGTLWGGNRAAYIATVDPTTGTVTFSSTWPTITLTAGGAITVGPQYLYQVSDVSVDTPANSWGRGREPNGLAAIVLDADPTFQDGLTGNWPQGLGEVPATVQTWRGNVIDNGGTPIPFAPDMLQQGMDLVDTAGDGTIAMWVTTHGIRRQYLNGLVAAKRYPNAMEMDGGFKALSYDGRPIVVDKDCTRGRIYGLDLESLFLAYETDYDWIDQDGSVLHRMPDADAFQACMYRYWNFCTEARNRNVALIDIMDV
jgi:hypothetical protein